MKSVMRAVVAAAVLAVSGAQAAPLVDLSGAYYETYGNVNSYSLPANAALYNFLNGGGTGPGNPYYVASTPGAIKDLVVIYTGASGQDVNTNAAGFDDAYGAPNGTKQFASINNNVNMADPGDKAGIANNNTQTWDASLLALKGFLGGFSPVFLFNNNDTNQDQNLAIWAKLWLTDGNNNVHDNRYLYLSNEGRVYGAQGVPMGDATLYNPGNVSAPATGFASSDYVLSGGQITFPLPDASLVTINHNLGANQVAYAGSVPVLNNWLNSLFALPDATLAGYTMHLDLRLGCTSITDWGNCANVKIDNGYEQLFLAAEGRLPPVVPEPAGVALTGLALAALAMTRRRRTQ